MKNLKPFAVLIFAISITLGCEETASETSGEVKTETTEEVTDIDEAQEEPQIEEEEAPQTLEERIQEIRELYAKIQSSPNQNNDCTSKSKTTINYDVIEEGIPFENKVKKCRLEEELMYQQVVLNGYEWQETWNFYYKDDHLFFIYQSGGSEAYGYDYRIYYDREGEVIRVLLAENDYDGQEVSAPFEVKSENRKKEILDSADSAKKEMDAILNEK